MEKQNISLKEPTPQIIKICELLEQKLTIPDYQRPYKWTIKNVNDLIDDFIAFQEKEAYRIGTIIIYDNKYDISDDTKKSKMEIVDGQQRFLTISLIYRALKAESDSNLLSLIVKDSELKFDNTISRNNLKDNYKHILSRIKEFDDSLIRFFLNKCELVQVTIYNIGEAFQFFDSQNSRGKELFPHNLLKAFHLREMNHLNQTEKISHINNWDATDANLLADAFSNYFFKIRQWSVGRTARYFGKDELYVFKGINLNNTISYPYAKSAAINAKYVSLKKNILYDYDSNQEHFPHQLDSYTVNGEWFFDFVKHKIKLVKKVKDFNNEMFKSLEENSKAQYIMQKLNSYDQSHRTGDRYCRQLFEVTLLYYIDKFGMNYLEKVIPIIFFWSYRPRIKHHAVRLESIDNHAAHWDGLIRKIRDSLQLSDILTYKIQPIENTAVNSQQLYSLFEKHQLIIKKS